MSVAEVKAEGGVRDTRYLLDELTAVEFKMRIQSILDEFEGKALLHRNIGQLARTWEQQNRALQPKFVEIWELLAQVSPRIREDSQPS